MPRYRAMADINMTPFIDVMLVLLIIFMVAAPLLSSGVPIDLPSTKAAALNIDKKPIAVAIDEHGDIFLMDQKIEASALAEAVKAQAKDGDGRARLCAGVENRALRARRGSHVRPDGGGFQESRAGDRSGEEIRRMRR